MPSLCRMTGRAVRRRLRWRGRARHRLRPGQHRAPGRRRARPGRAGGHGAGLGAVGRAPASRPARRPRRVRCAGGPARTGRRAGGPARSPSRSTRGAADGPLGAGPGRAGDRAGRGPQVGCRRRVLLRWGGGLPRRRPRRPLPPNDQAGARRRGRVRARHNRPATARRSAGEGAARRLCLRRAALRHPGRGPGPGGRAGRGGGGGPSPALHRRGASLRQVADALTAEGHQPRRGERWHPTTVARMVRVGGPDAL